MDSPNNKENKGILDDKYILLDKIGEGTSGKVYLSEEIVSHQKYAIKIFNEKCIDEYERELKILQKIQNKNIIKYISNGTGSKLKHGFKSNKLDYIVLENAEKGELFYFVSSVKKGFDENISKYIFKEILYGINSLHENGYSHSDIKLDNILLDKDFNIKLSDFSFSQELKGKNGDGKLIEKKGTIGYFPPEFITQKTYNGIKSDIYSLGITLFALVTGGIPFPKKNSLLDAIKTRSYNSKLKFYKESLNDLNLSDDFFNLCFKMISLNPDDRYNNIEEILKDPWLNNDCSNLLDVLNELSSRENHVHQEKEILNLNKQMKKEGIKKDIFRCTEEIKTFFKHDIPIKQYKEYKNVFDKNLIILNNIQPIEFMNIILNDIEKDDEIYNKIEIDCSPDNLKAIIKFSNDDDEEEDYETIEFKILIIEIKLMRIDENDKYIMIIRRKGGDLKEFNDALSSIKNIIEEN
jgi:serine/threonine protein kinase